MKKNLLFLFFILMSIGSAFGAAATLPVDYTFEGNSYPIGCSGYSIKLQGYKDTHRPYRLQFDDTGDYLQIEVDGAVEQIIFAVKMIGGSSTSSFQIKGCSTENGTYSNVGNSFSISGSQNTIVNCTTSVSINSTYRFFRFIFTKGSNVGFGILKMSKSSISPTTYTVHFVDSLNHNFDSTSTSTVLLPTPIISEACNLNRWKFDSWRNRNGVKIPGNSITLTSDTTLYAWYKIFNDDIDIEHTIDTLTYTDFNATSTSYKSFNNIHGANCHSNARYSGVNAAGNNAIQLNSNIHVIDGDSLHPGIISNISGGFLESIEVKWNTHTQNGNIIEIYQSDTSYINQENLYNDGKKLNYDSLIYGVSNQLSLSNKPYIGIRSHKGAIYLDAIYITWSNNAPKYSANPKCFSTDINVAEWFKDSVKFDIGNYDSIHTYIQDNLPSISCDSIRIELTRNDSSCIRWFHVPIFAEGSMSVEPECDVVVLGGKTFTPTDGSQSKNVSVYPGGKLIVNDTYTIDTLILRRDNDSLPQFLYKGTLSGVKGIHFDLRTDGSDWRWLTLPFAHKVSDVRYQSGKQIELNNKVWVSYYDGYYRSRQKSGAWKDIGTEGAVSDTTFLAGQGFLFGIDSDVKKIYRFSFLPDSLAHEKGDKSVKGLHAWGAGLNLTENHKGWNLIGNPLMYNDTTDIIDPIRVGRLVRDTLSGSWNGSWIVDSSAVKKGNKLRYAVIPNKDEKYASAGYYESVVLDDYVLKPFTCFFVQIGGESEDEMHTINFEQSKRINNIVARRVAADEDKELFLRVKVGSWKTGCFISSSFSDDYEPGDDLESHYPIYQTIGGYGLLYSAINDSIINAGINVHAPAGLLYLDSKTNVNDFEEIYALYNNEWYDLLHGQTVEVDGDFILQAKRKTQDVATDVDKIETPNEMNKFIHNGTLYILNNNHIYNAVGARIR